MITDEQINLVATILATPLHGVLVRRALEAYENSKPKPNPVGYVKTVGGYPDESEHKVEWVVKHKELKDGQPLYTTPPTREPLSDEQLATIITNGYWYDYTHYDLARAIEQAHGIGVTNAQPQTIPTR